jgi:ADP-heptose:LPS heptosyltransferase
VFIDRLDNIFAPGKKLESFSDTAAICKHLDQVISVDTSVAHLSAALGTPTSVLLAYRPDWRWGAEGETSRWYSSARLIRQTCLGGWEKALSTWHVDCLQDLT